MSKELNYDIFQDNKTLNTEEVLEKMSFILSDDSNENIIDIINKDPNLVIKNDYHLVKLVCWINNMDLLDKLISYGALDYFETANGINELKELEIYSPKIKSHIISRLKSKKLHKKLNLELVKNSSKNSILIKI